MGIIWAWRFDFFFNLGGTAAAFWVGFVFLYKLHFMVALTLKKFGFGGTHGYTFSGGCLSFNPVFGWQTCTESTVGVEIFLEEFCFSRADIRNLFNKVFSQFSETSNFVSLCVEGIFGKETVTLAGLVTSIIVGISIKFTIGVFIVLDVAITLTSEIEDTEISIEEGIEGSVSAIDSLGNKRFFYISKVPNSIFSISVSIWTYGNNVVFFEPGNLALIATFAVCWGRVLELFRSHVSHSEVFILPGWGNQIRVETPFETDAVFGWTGQIEFDLSFLDVPNLHGVVETRGG